MCLKAILFLFIKSLLIFCRASSIAWSTKWRRCRSASKAAPVRWRHATAAHAHRAGSASVSRLECVERTSRREGTATRSDRKTLSSSNRLKTLSRHRPRLQKRNNNNNRSHNNNNNNRFLSQKDTCHTWLCLSALCLCRLKRTHNVLLYRRPTVHTKSSSSPPSSKPNTKYSKAPRPRTFIWRHSTHAMPLQAMTCTSAGLTEHLRRTIGRFSSRPYPAFASSHSVTRWSSLSVSFKTFFRIF